MSRPFFFSIITFFKSEENLQEWIGSSRLVKWKKGQVSMQNFHNFPIEGRTKARTLYQCLFILSCSNSESFSIWIYWVKLKLNLFQKRSFLLTKIGLRNQCCFHLYFDSYLWSSFEYKNWWENSAKAEQFVFISEQSAKHHNFCSYHHCLSSCSSVQNK